MMEHRRPPGMSDVQDILALNSCAGYRFRRFPALPDSVGMGPAGARPSLDVRTRAS